MSDTRKKDANWRIKTNSDGATPSMDAQLAVLMDIRDELQTLNGILRCFKFQRLPDDLRSIDRRLQKAGFLLRPKKRSRK